MSVFRRVLVSLFGALCLLVGAVAFGAVAPVSADPPGHAQNDGKGNSDSPGRGNGGGQGTRGGQDHDGDQGNGRGSKAQGGGTAGSSEGGDATAGGSSGSNPDGGGLDKPDCESTAEGCQGPAPRDGNNGCGNEAEPKSVRDDDNNGNCGGGRTNDTGAEESATTIAGIAAKEAWRGTAGYAVVRAMGAAALAQGEVQAGEDTEVLGVSAQQPGPSTSVDLKDLELARESSGESGARSLLALTGMALMTLLAIGLFAIGVGRLLRGAEAEGSS